MNTVGHSCLLSNFRVISQYRNQLLIYLGVFFLNTRAKRPFSDSLCCEENPKISVYKDKTVEEGFPGQLLHITAESFLLHPSS